MNKDLAFQKLVEMISDVHQVEDDLLAGVRGIDLTEQQLNMMTILSLSGPKNLSTLSRCMNINLPNCSREVKKLSHRGLIQKSPSKEDKRVTDLSLTPEGERTVQSLFLEMKSLFFKRSGAWDEARSSRLMQAAELIREELANYTHGLRQGEEL